MREHIFRAAAGVFAQRGYRAATMQDIAAAAGFSAPSLYTYFEGKKQILQALAQATEHQVQAIFVEPVPGGLTFEQQFELLLNRLVGYVDANREAIGFLFLADQELEGPDDKAGLRGFEWVRTLFAGWLVAHAKKRDLGRHGADVAAQYLTGIVFAAVFRWVSGEVVQIPKLAAEIRGIFFHGVAGG